MAELNSGWVGSDTERIVTVEDARAITAALIAPGVGLRSRAGWFPSATTAEQGQVTANGTPNATVNVAPFQYHLNNSAGVFGYIITNDAPKSIDILTANPSDPSNNRNDLIIAQQSDAFYGDANSEMVIRHIVGTPNASPVDPTITGSANYVLLARVVVTAGATTITNAMITNLRPAAYTVARGGILPVANSSEQTAADEYDGFATWRKDNDTLYIYNGSSQVAIGSAAQTTMVTDHETRLDAIEADTGIITLPNTLATNWDTATDVIQYRLRGKHLHMHCQVTRTNTAITANAAGNVSGDPLIFTITTVGLRPPWPIHVIGRGTVTSGAVYIDTDGTCKIGDLHSTSSIAVGDELRFSASWLVA